ncbi:MAG: hypothetical protein QGH55_04470 [Acidimicrobiales bacterium]|nr:hypothetical protein [Acidimicrobiales bacterium]
MDGRANHHYGSGGLRLAAHLERPDPDEVAVNGDPLPDEGVPAVLICHGFPSAPGGGANSPATFPELARRISKQLGWVAMVPYLRGMPGSEGNFSLDGWRDDLLAAARHLRDSDEVGVQVGGIWAVGFGTGAGLAICAAAVEPAIRGVGALATPADWSDWADNPRRLLLHARDAGLLSDPEFPTDFHSWAGALGSISPEACVDGLRPRDLLLVHGSNDNAVPPLDARALAAAHGAADLRMISGAGHHLRHDPRAIAVLLGWLVRQRRLNGRIG